MTTRHATHLGRYEILTELGRGAMGVVYKARDPQIDRLVAIKTISLFGQSPEDEHEYLHRFFFEARAAGKLSHPGIVTIFDVGEAPETRAPYIVMEYVAGQSLNKILTQIGKLPMEQALTTTQELAEALDYAHTQGVVHRDMKPANVLLTEEGRAKITDFGIAKLNLAQITVPGHVLGTPAYMSPEQLEGGTVDGRSDLFSLGVMLYTMLTGHRPFQGNSAMTVSFKVANREPVPVSAFESHFPPEIDYVVARAIAKDAAQRYQTGREMALDINELLGGRVPRSKGDKAIPNPGSALTAATINILRETFAIGPSLLSAPQSRIPRYSALVSSIRRTILYPRRTPPKRFLAGALVLMAAIGLYAWRQSGPGTPPATTPVSFSPAEHPVKPAGNVSAAGPIAPAKPEHKPVAASSTLQLEIKHHFAQGRLSVWVDGKLVRKASFHGESKKRLVLFRGNPTEELVSLPIAVGEHDVRVRVEVPAAGYDQLATITASFTANGKTTLHVNCDKPKKLDVTL